LSFGFNWRINGHVPFPIRIPAGGSAYVVDVLPITGKPFFNILSENSTIKLFLDAIAHNTEEAVCFISKNCVKSIDLFELKDTFEDGGFKYLSSMEDAPNGKENRRTNTVLLFNNKSKQKTILRLYMVREPDQFGQWKIFNVERE
jgi:hypothetical protein